MEKGTTYWWEGRRVAVAAAAVACVLALGAYLHRLPPSLGIHDNTVADLVQARHCIDDGVCASAGQRSTFGGLVQGGAWPLYLVVCLRTGLSVDGVARVSALLAALAVGLLVFAVARLESLATGLLAGALLLAAWPLTRTVLDIQWNPSLLPLPAAAFAALVALSLAQRRWYWVAGAALVGSLCAQIHLLAALPLGAALAWWLLLPPRRPWLAGVVGTAGALGLAALLSFDALAVAWTRLASGVAAQGSNSVFQQQTGPLLVLTVTMAAGGALIWLARRSKLGLPVFHLFVMTQSALLVMLAALGGVALVPHYLVPLMPALCWTGSASAAGWLAVAAGRRVAVLFGAVALLAAPVAVGLWPAVVPPSVHTFQDVDDVAAALRSEGIETLAAAACRLRAPQRFHLLAGLSAVMPAGDPLVPCDALASSWLVLHGRQLPDPLPESWHVFPRRSGWLVVIPRREHLDWSRAWRTGRAGPVPVGPGLDPACAVPGMPAARGMCGVELGDEVAWQVPVVADDPRSMNIFALSGPGRPDSHFDVVRGDAALDVYWSSGVAGRFDALGLPLILLVGPQEEALTKLLVGLD